MEQQPALQSTIPFQFDGKATEYFGIWIVNILLTIITIGIYTAWAKVRTNRYFYGKTLLNDSNFAYLADPIAILKGWLIAVAILILYSVIGNFIPIMELIFFLLLIIATPWLVIKSMRFRTRNSAWQNIRYAFNAKYGEAAFIFIGLGFFGVIVTLGTLMPYVQYRVKKFMIDNSSYGQTNFEFNASAKDFYMVYLFGMGLFALLIIGLVVAGAGIGFISQASAAEPQPMPPEFALAQAFIVPFILLFYLLIFAYFQSRIGNLTWSNVHIQGNQLQSSLRARDLAWIYFSNLVAIMISFGLLVPWAKVRTVRYRMNKLKLLAAGNLDQFVQAEQQKVSALGEEVGEVFDMDIGI